MRIWIIQYIQFLNQHWRWSYFNFRKWFQKMYGIRTEWRINKKLKSIRHYLVNNDNDTAWKFYKQLEKAINEKRYTTEQ